MRILPARCHDRHVSHQQLSLGVGDVSGADREAVTALASALIDRIEDARSAAHLGHRQLALRAGLPASTVRSALSKTGNPQLDTLIALATAVGLRVTLTAG